MFLVLLSMLLVILLFVLFYLKSRFLDIMIKEIESPYDFDETVETLKKSIEEKEGWHIFNIINQSNEILKNGGSTLGKITIIQYCHAIFASRMFSEDSRRKISVFSPKSVSIYTKNNGKTYVSMMNGALMKFVTKGETKNIVKDVSREVRQLMSVLHKGNV